MVSSLAVAFFVVVVYEIFWMINRKAERRKIYSKALKKSQETGKKLLVIGDPNNGSGNKITGKDYECGDICVDLTGCPGCTVGVKGDIRNVIKGMKDNEYVIFCSCVLEYVDGDITDLVKDLVRVSGGDLFIVSVEKWSIIAYIYYGRLLTGESGAKRIILEYPPYNNEIKWKNF